MIFNICESVPVFSFPPSLSSGEAAEPDGAECQTQYPYDYENRIISPGA